MSLNQQSKSRSSSYLARTQGFLRTQLWVWPLVAAVLLAFVAVTLRLKMESAMKQQIASNLQVILNANAEALRAWSATVKSDAENLADEEPLRALVVGLLPKTAPGNARYGATAGRARTSGDALTFESLARPARIRRVCRAGHQLSGHGFPARSTGRHGFAARLRGAIFQLPCRSGPRHEAFSQFGDAIGCERQVACRSAHHVRGCAGQVGGR